MCARPAQDGQHKPRRWFEAMLFDDTKVMPKWVTTRIKSAVVRDELEGPDSKVLSDLVNELYVKNRSKKQRDKEFV